MCENKRKTQESRIKSVLLIVVMMITVDQVLNNEYGRHKYRSIHFKNHFSLITNKGDATTSSGKSSTEQKRRRTCVCFDSFIVVAVIYLDDVVSSMRHDDRLITLIVVITVLRCDPMSVLSTIVTVAIDSDGIFLLGRHGT